MSQRTALITGGGSGIGLACAAALADAGLHVGLVGRNADALGRAGVAIAARGGTSTALVADLAADGAIPLLEDRVRATLGSVDVLVNNAGMGSAHRPAAVVDMDPDFWAASLHLNLTVPFLLSRAFVPAMVERGFGRVVNVSSTYGKVGAALGSAYAASKHGLLGLTRSLALEVCDRGVTVNAICPGGTRTPMSDVKLGREADRLGVSMAELIRRRYPAGRRVEPDEVGALVAFLAGDAAAGLTGAAIDIDLGRLAG